MIRILRRNSRLSIVLALVAGFALAAVLPAVAPVAAAASSCCCAPAVDPGSPCGCGCSISERPADPRDLLGSGLIRPAAPAAGSPLDADCTLAATGPGDATPADLAVAGRASPPRLSPRLLCLVLRR